MRELQEWIEAWARFCGLLPRSEGAAVEPEQHEAAVDGGSTATQRQVSHSVAIATERTDGARIATSRQPAPAPGSCGTPKGPRQVEIRERFFKQKLAEAQAYFDEMRRVLEAAGATV